MLEEFEEYMKKWGRIEYSIEKNEHPIYGILFWVKWMPKYEYYYKNFDLWDSDVWFDKVNVQFDRVIYRLAQQEFLDISKYSKDLYK